MSEKEPIHTFTIRIPKSVAERIKLAAWIKRVSVNRWCVAELTQDAEQCIEEKIDEPQRSVA